MPWKMPESDQEPEYIGNMWGWKFSTYAGIFLLIVFLLTLPQQCHYMKTGEQVAPTETPEG